MKTFLDCLLSFVLPLACFYLGAHLADQGTFTTVITYIIVIGVAGLNALQTYALHVQRKLLLILTTFFSKIDEITRK